MTYDPNRGPNQQNVHERAPLAVLRRVDVVVKAADFVDEVPGGEVAPEPVEKEISYDYPEAA